MGSITQPPPPGPPRRPAWLIALYAVLGVAALLAVAGIAFVGLLIATCSK